MNSDSKDRIQALLIQATDTLGGVYSLGTRDVRSEIEYSRKMLDQENYESVVKHLRHALGSSSFMQPAAPAPLVQHLTLALVHASREYATLVVRTAEAQATAIGLKV